jgi:NIMA-interacting peptidyl-prolyl cis-trans isomerase 1
MSLSKGAPYFFNSETKTSSWEPPADLTEELIKQLPGANLLDPKSAAPAALNKVRASHLLVKHSGSRRPSSWKDVGIFDSKRPSPLC